MCKLAVSHREAKIQVPAWVEIPRLKCYNGSRNVREVDSFIGGLEQFFKASGIIEDTIKIETAPLYITEAVRLRWRQRHADIRKGLCSISNWASLKKKSKGNSIPRMLRWRHRPSLDALLTVRVFGTK